MASIESIHALILDLRSLVLDNNKRIDNLALQLNSLQLPSDPAVDFKKRTRTITPVSDGERCSQTLVSGKNKGGKCSKKSTIGSFCTLHHKLLNLGIPSSLSDEFVPDYILDQEKLDNTPKN
jgi:hypothetical protein